jgi:hypothetical protein
MTLVSRTRLFAVLSLITLASLPMNAAAVAKKRAVGTLPNVTISGVITDSTTGLPVRGVEVWNGNMRSQATGDDGRYTLILPAGRQTLITAKYFAFHDLAKTVIPASGMKVDFSLVPNPAITVKMVNGDSYILDFATTQFAYVIVFSGYVRDDNANFCKPDGSHWSPNKSEFNKIAGPGTMVNFSPCCSSNSTLVVNVEMKSGEKTAAYFNDACAGNEPDLIGRERSSGNFRYLPFKDIAEVSFP